MNREELMTKITEYPICEYAFIDPGKIQFLDQVRYICETECPQYGKSWSCPPAVGSVQECKDRCRQFKEGFLFTTVSEVEDMENMESMLKTRLDHEEITRKVRDLFLSFSDKLLVLSTESCDICENCAYPDAPCRFPNKMFPCVESYGILVTDLAESNGISFMNGSNLVTWFSLILFDSHTDTGEILPNF